MTWVRGSGGPRAAFKKQLDVELPVKKPEVQEARKPANTFQVKDGFDAPKPTSPGATRTASTSAVAQVNGDPAYQEALKTQRELSNLRQEMGRLQLELENRNPLEHVRDWFSSGDNQKQDRINQLQQQITSLEQVERTQPQEAVERARFTVFTERMAQLETQLGKEGAATIARQTYYNSDVWNAAAGTDAASPGAINAAGLPHVPGNNSNEAVGGYSGEMRTPDGQQVDMGHVAAALDWQVNADRIPSLFRIPQTGGLVPIPNPFDLQAVTLTGDVASAMTQTNASGNVAANADRAIANQQDYDWNGDIDGLNLANRLKNNPNLSITQALNDYYGGGQYQKRLDEFATHSPYIRRDANGVPQRDAQGNYVVDTAKLSDDARNFAEILDKDVGGILGVSEGNYPATEVTEAWTRWLHTQQEAARNR